MKICVSATGADLSASLDPRFGRCRMFLFVDPENMTFDAVTNPALSADGGAGTQAAQLVAGNGARAVLTGNVGPNAFTALDAAGIEIYTGLSGSVQAAVEQFKKGELQTTSSPSVESHAGMGRGGGAGKGR